MDGSIAWMVMVMRTCHACPHPTPPNPPAASTYQRHQLEEGLALADTADKPRILLMGPRRSGKTSIERVVFHKMSPHETLFLESTHGLVGG